MLGFLLVLNGVVIGIAFFIGAILSWGRLFGRGARSAPDTQSEKDSSSVA